MRICETKMYGTIDESFSVFSRANRSSRALQGFIGCVACFRCFCQVKRLGVAPSQGLAGIAKVGIVRLSVLSCSSVHVRPLEI